MSLSYPDKINLGCGDDYRDGWHNIDIRDDVRTDDIIDLDQDTWMLPANEFDHALMDNVIEHLDDRKNALENLHRILEPKATATLRFPHWNSPGHYTTPTHTKTITHRTFNNYEVDSLFDVQSVNCTRVRFGRLLPETVALYAADHIGHLVSEVEVEVVARTERMQSSVIEAQFSISNR